MIIPSYILPIISYFFGSIPFGLILSKIFLKKDVRKIGSKNIGATNVMRLGNKKIAALTLILDMLKAFLPVKIAMIMNFSNVEICFLFAILGHIFPIWLRFRGGKGVASFLGGILAISPLSAICFILSWLIIFKIFKISGLSSIISCIITMLVYFLYVHQNAMIILVIGSLLIIKHYENIIIMLKGKERSFKKK